EDVEPVGRRVEQLADPADLAERAGDLAVEVVGGAADREQEDGPAVVVRPVEDRLQDQPEEQRHAEQSQQAERVGDGPDLVARRRLRHGAKSTGCRTSRMQVAGRWRAARWSDDQTCLMPRTGKACAKARAAAFRPA